MTSSAVGTEFSLWSALQFLPCLLLLPVFRLGLFLVRDPERSEDPARPSCCPEYSALPRCPSRDVRHELCFRLQVSGADGEVWCATCHSSDPPKHPQRSPWVLWRPRRGPGRVREPGLLSAPPIGWEPLAKPKAEPGGAGCRVGTGPCALVSDPSPGNRALCSVSCPSTRGLGRKYPWGCFIP